MPDEPVVLKHAVGLETTGDKHTPIFVRGLHLPVAWSKMLLPATDNQDEIVVHILQGDSIEAGVLGEGGNEWVKCHVERLRRCDIEVDATALEHAKKEMDLRHEDIQGYWQPRSEEQ